MPDRSPGGSSGGCAAAIAAALVPLSVGTDYGGSVRLPAAACEIVALRPTPGRVPAGGQLPPAPAGSPRHTFSIVGPLACDVAHLRLAFEALDPQAETSRGPLPARVAVAGEGAEVRHIAALLAEAGIETVAAEPPFLSAAEECFTAWRHLDTYEDLRPIADRLGPALRTLIANAPEERDDDAHRQLARQAKLLRAHGDAFLAEYQLLVMPVARCQLPPPAGAPVAFDDLGPCRAISLLELPAVTVGGVQLVAPRGCDERALELAEVIERQLEAAGPEPGGLFAAPGRG
jgi:amidase